MYTLFGIAYFCYSVLIKYLFNSYTETLYIFNNRYPRTPFSLPYTLLAKPHPYRCSVEQMFVYR
nr:MAG TPA: hypothetical protein [Caudoviricetes sp.]